MTRSFVCLCHGQIARAYTFHRAGPLLFLCVLIQIPVRLHALLNGRARALLFESRKAQVLAAALVAGMLLNWGYDILTGAALGPGGP
jgi:hypothetical protein